MSREAAEIVRSAFDATATRGLEESAERFWHPEIEYVEDPRWPGASSYKGRDAVLGCWRGYTETLGSEENFTISVERVLDAGERQVPLIRFRSRGSSSGVPHEHVWAYVVGVKEGRIAYLRAYYEPSDALEAVGLSE